MPHLLALIQQPNYPSIIHRVFQLFRLLSFSAFSSLSLSSPHSIFQPHFKMLFNLKSAFLLGLVIVSYASPIANANAEEASLATLQRRAKIPDEVTCDGKKFTK